MYKGGNQDLGRWNDNNCGNIMPFFCRKQQSPGIALGQEINSNRKCKSGWLEVNWADKKLFSKFLLRFSILITNLAKLFLFFNKFLDNFL